MPKVGDAANPGIGGAKLLKLPAIISLEKNPTIAGNVARCRAPTHGRSCPAQRGGRGQHLPPQHPPRDAVKPERDHLLAEIAKRGGKAQFRSTLFPSNEARALDGGTMP